MANTYVVIDLETTGLDCNTDKIIEIAAVKVKRGLIIDEFSSLVAIDGSLPEEISSLTGISDEMLLGQPRIEDLIPALSDFIGEADIVAHNAEFDSSFLLRYWPDPRPWIDSITLAQIAYPCQPSYALAWLVKNLELENHSAHRALADALATAELLIRIEKELSGFPDFLQEQLSALASGDESATGAFIRRCCSGRGGAAAPAGQTVRGSHQRREINEEYCLDVDALADYFGERAEFKERIPGFEERPQQLQLAQEVARTLNNGGCLLAEAGTGTGKSLAYLLPAALYARGSGKQIAVSTHTRNLQEQLWQKDIPMLSALLDTPVKAAVLKGRSNYLCRRLYRYFANEPSEEMRYFLMRIAVWRVQTKDGELGDLSLNSFSRRYWQRLCASRENCAPFCPYRQKNSCCVQKARMKAAEAEILIINHSLLIANAANEGALLPELPYLIIDEAQHLEHATEDQLTSAVDFFDILNLLGRYERKERGKRAGVIPALEKTEPGLFDSISAERIAVLAAKLADDVAAVLAAAEKFYDVADQFFQQERSRQAFLPVKIRIMPQHLQSPDWQLVAQLSEEAAAALNVLAADSFTILDLVRANAPDDGEETGRLPKGCEELFSLGNISRELAGTLTACINDENANFVSWVEYSDLERRPAINIAPVEINELLHDLLYEKTEALVMTSATLGIGKDFSYFKQRTGIDLLPLKPRELVLPSPFFYREQSLFTIVNDLPDWSRCSEIEAVEAISSALIRLLTASKGRAIVLFTSHAQLKSVYKQIVAPLNNAGINVLAHGVSGAPSMLLERLKSEENCCILGAASFWEGVDVIGEALSLIVVVRLPFWPPNTPLAATRMERIEAEGKSPFWDYSLPMALIRFKQGFGRLIRSDKDSGVFCVLDKRIIEKRYGASFIRSLPEMQRISGTTEEIAAEIKKWLG